MSRCRRCVWFHVFLSRSKKFHNESKRKLHNLFILMGFASKSLTWSSQIYGFIGGMNIYVSKAQFFSGSIYFQIYTDLLLKCTHRIYTVWNGTAHHSVPPSLPSPPHPHPRIGVGVVVFFYLFLCQRVCWLFSALVCRPSCIYLRIVALSLSRLLCSWISWNKVVQWSLPSSSSSSARLVWPSSCCPSSRSERTRKVYSPEEAPDTGITQTISRFGTKCLRRETKLFL